MFSIKLESLFCKNTDLKRFADLKLLKNLIIMLFTTISHYY